MKKPSFIFHFFCTSLTFFIISYIFFAYLLLSINYKEGNIFETIIDYITGSFGAAFIAYLYFFLALLIIATLRYFIKNKIVNLVSTFLLLFCYGYGLFIGFSDNQYRPIHIPIFKTKEIYLIASIISSIIFLILLNIITKLINSYINRRKNNMKF
ncbi:hypothetical protein PL75_04220 [Neisseria arctica]|uniref:Uncharacterized protein n=1 Tax=Neisseria arctica TaxID=1470200 RepID=A0A0J0YSJ2_9NEIS|nr:hypothetical protein [Neisseria arctica]KLT73120.1 hypothetical protein PL75_04220 [Neisseria arctica]UOO87151.1 hypothetical protein LVJ86_02555 [Neisseria arctica]